MAIEHDEFPTQLWITRPPCRGRTIYVASCCPLPMRRHDWTADDYDVLQNLYSGKASELHAAQCKLSHMTVALKKYRKDKLSELNWHQVQREVRIHSRLRHENIIQLYAAFEDDTHVYLVQEYAEDGDLYEELKSSGGRFSEARTAGEILQPCLNALQYLHSMGIIHRDIKPENILIASDQKVKLADFGLSLDSTEERPVTRAGTLDYMSPEVLLCPEKSRPEENKEKVMLHYTDQVDAWAMGILAFELMVGRAPFQHKERADTYEHILSRSPAFPAWMTEGARSFIKSALHKTPRKRPSISTMLQHPWILQHAAVPQAFPVQSPDLLNEASPADSSMQCNGEECLSADGNHSGFESSQTTMFKASSIFEWTVTKHLRRLLKSSSDKDDNGHRPEQPTARCDTVASRALQQRKVPMQSPFALHPGGPSYENVELRGGHCWDQSGTQPSRKDLPHIVTALSCAPTFHQKASLDGRTEYDSKSVLAQHGSAPLFNGLEGQLSGGIKAHHFGSCKSLAGPVPSPHKYPLNFLIQSGSGSGSPPSPALFSRASSASSIASPVASRRACIAGADSRIPPPSQGYRLWQHTCSPHPADMRTGPSDPFQAPCLEGSLSFPLERMLPGFNRNLPNSPFRSRSSLMPFPVNTTNPTASDALPPARSGVKRSLTYSATQSSQTGWPS